MQVVPVTLREARAYVDRVHRHHPAPQGGLFAVAVADEEIRGVAIVGMPVSRHLADGWTVEVTRVATDGAPNSCSMLYGACWRAARALGWRRLVTYTLRTEPGTSLRAAGWRVVAEVRADGWNHPSRPRVETVPAQDRFRWEKVS